MDKLSTFEDIFNKLFFEYKGIRVGVRVKQDGIEIANFITHIDNIVIKPLNKKYSKGNKRIGLIVIQEKKGENCFNIPFILDFNTMYALFCKNGVNIKSMNMEFVIKRKTAQSEKSA
ncbi:hypothetical protein GM661_16905 [Iocasia frigidifontis]|uniref:Uncharacterized protein n=1 Tax=Iocasia fonsfrigidae TaxID=2682810 RepID=A0A8A7KIU2_9FIRM|nr:hypothetical protein [Iocasia fonsfrigidae]QTL99509.1 hypothetical protein GM661_16905 [Iocasia fonsfrigidae]